MIGMQQVLLYLKPVNFKEVKMQSPREITKGFYKPERDGITQSLLHKFLFCRQQALWDLQGYSLRSPSFALTYGNIVHAVLEKVYEKIRLGKITKVPSSKLILKFTKEIEHQWVKENPRANQKALEFLELSLLIAESTLPIYFDYWSKDLKSIKWEKIESSFKLPFKLQDGRKTFIRGKLDGAFRNPKLWLFETKTKMRIEEDSLVEYLGFELQVNLYIMALLEIERKQPSGVLYNIIRRTALRQGKKENLKQFALRISNDIKKRPEYYFIRLEIAFTKEDTLAFKNEFSALIKDFYDWFDGKVGHYKNTGNCEGKYGACEFLKAENKIMAPYEKRKTVFKELEDN